jgi:phosphoglycolate phosphatase
LDLAGADSGDAIMIGDRAEDVRAARAHGIGAVAVGWGYGAPEELRDARPDYFAPTIADLVAYATQPASR